MRLDHFIAKSLRVSERTAREAIASGQAAINGEVERNHLSEVSQFCEVTHRGDTVQSAGKRRYLMLNKPVGVLSATSDKQHTTVVDLIDLPDRDTLHLAGRLDRSSSGLVLLTNDGEWSASLTEPERKVDKVYLVETDRPIPPGAPERFAEGFPFSPENITTLPAKLEILSPVRARVTLHEGRYHQIKRMFHRLDGIRLRSLHRESIGTLKLPDDLKPGEWREILPEEVRGGPQS